MFNEAAETAQTSAELEAALEAAELFLARSADYQADLVAAGSDDFAAYWASSASASVMRDYRAGRAVTVRG